MALKIRILIINIFLMAAMGFVYGAAEDCDESLACVDGDDCLPCQFACCAQGFISMDLLYWRVFESGLDICRVSETSETITPGGTVISRFSGRGRSPNFKWSPGFRIGAGSQLSSTDGDVSGFWTHLSSHTTANNAELQWHIDFDIVEVVGGYQVDLNPCFSLRPFGGLHGGVINQKLQIDEFIALDFSTINSRKQQKFSGIGPILGIEANWNIICAFSLYARVSVSWLYGRYTIRLIESSASVDTIDTCEVRKRLSANLPAADAAIGIRWHRCICRNMRLILQLGLEHHSYFDYNRIGDYGSLNFDGVNFSAGIEF